MCTRLSFAADGYLGSELDHASGRWHPLGARTNPASRVDADTGGQQRPAFTLIEVLVVVAIIALLVAILLPSLARARYSAWRTVCFHNLNQLGVGMVAYALENREYLPLCKQVKDIGPVRIARGGDIYYGVGSDDMSGLYPKYIKDAKLWVCPGARNAVKTREDIRHTYAADASYRIGSAYEYNPFMFIRIRNPDPNGWPRILIDEEGTVSLLRWSKLKHMASVTVAHDSDDATLNIWPDEDDPHGVLKGGNMLYADGHAQWIQQKFWYQETDAGRPVVAK